jgi:hypothetical protein
LLLFQVLVEADLEVHMAAGAVDMAGAADMVVAADGKVLAGEAVAEADGKEASVGAATVAEVDGKEVLAGAATVAEAEAGMEAEVVAAK